ncbi:uncharacterized protein BHQ10_010269 [Talaromyces amestolkiae]|uniref:Uncharacterized protein n=1 Tax=Talaromyces amestolkiae TaxID=1196081 RepID=A0A364LEN7_TALAM|nr:uncharacterized protein BHQ10_010269 [Talaromyces amestolkiae]RAO74257.1 hypothetical protein BHQ10_010269 [Talaromyces amestolkiae]
MADAQLAYHLSLLQNGRDVDQRDETALAPIFMGSLLRQTNPIPAQYGLLAGLKRIHHPEFANTGNGEIENDSRTFFNIASPMSRLSNPLTAVVFHYDTFICDTGGSPCEAAFLSSHPGITVRVLCAPTNLQTIKMTYSRFNIEVEPLQIDQSSLNTKRMLDLMAVGQEKGPIPLYVHTVLRILREMRLLQQEDGSRFDYHMFKKKILAADLLPSQLDPLMQRLETLESFMPRQQPSLLTIVDLSCPCITPETACSLFNVCFEIFMEQDTNVGRVVALDEAHKSRLYTNSHHQPGYALYKVMWLPRPWELSQEGTHNAIVDLNVGEALLFAPGAILENKTDETNSQRLRRLGAGYMVVKIRKRLTEDGGQSVLSA